MSIAEGAKALIDEGLLDGAGLGIAQFIASTGSTAGLSEKQLFVYNKYIAQHFSKRCETEDCPFEIEIDFIADAIRNEARGDSVLCQHCLYVAEINAEDK